MTRTGKVYKKVTPQLLEFPKPSRKLIVHKEFSLDHSGKMLVVINEQQYMLGPKGRRFIFKVTLCNIFEHIAF